ncbi:MAG: rhomboid family intramembrane serine protease [Phycisphaerae bacterium]
MKTPANKLSSTSNLGMWHITFGIVAVNVLVHVAGIMVQRVWPSYSATWQLYLWNSPRLVTERFYLWQLLTANFVHSGILHLSINMFFVLWLGPRLERALGARRFLLIYLAMGTFAYAVFDLYAHFLGPWSATGGASGCVLGLATLYTLCFPKWVIPFYGFINIPFRWVVLLFIFSDVTSFFWPGGIPWINNVVHLSGAAFGAGVWFWIGRTVGGRGKDRPT